MPLSTHRGWVDLSMFWTSRSSSETVVAVAVDVAEAAPAASAVAEVVNPADLLVNVNTNPLEAR